MAAQNRKDLRCVIMEYDAALNQGDMKLMIHSDLWARTASDVDHWDTLHSLIDMCLSVG